MRDIAVRVVEIGENVKGLSAGDVLVQLGEDHLGVRMTLHVPGAVWGRVKPHARKVVLSLLDRDGPLAGLYAVHAATSPVDPCCGFVRDAGAEIAATLKADGVPGY